MGDRRNVETLDTAWPRIRTILEQMLSGTKVSRAAWYDAFHDVYLYSGLKEDSPLYLLTKEFLFDFVARQYRNIQDLRDNEIVAAYIWRWSLYLTGCRQLIPLYYCCNKLDVDGVDLPFFNNKADKQEMIKKWCMEAWKVNMLDKMGNDLIECVVQDRAEHRRLTAAQVEEVANSLVKVYYVLQAPKETDEDYNAIEVVSKTPYVGDIEAL